MNLTTDPWIPVIGADGRQRSVSLHDLFASAHELRDLSVKPHERIALLRLLICITQAALDGPKNYDAWETCREAIQSAAKRYLDKWAASFELFGDGQRFLQVPGLKAAKEEGDGNPATKLDLTLASGNNASLFEADAASAFDARLFDQHMAVNLRAPLQLASDFAAQLPEGREGLIVNLLDQRVWRLNPHFFSYTLTKSALWTATQTMAQAFAPRIRVNGVGPGPTLANHMQRPEDFRREAESIPLQRAITPDEIVAAVLFLLEARSVTGQMIAVDGGQHLAWKTPDVLD